jgi:hypothetical protein
MKDSLKILAIFSLIILPVGWISQPNSWISEYHNGYNIFYKPNDKANIKAYNIILDKGIKSVTTFFGAPFKDRFDIYIYPNRHLIDSTWQIDWKMPEFKSECWMVASGVASKLDLISPKYWIVESCEHDYQDTLQTQNLITHELVHVYHGQLNQSPDFSDMTGLDWFVEGLAVYASGQCDSIRLGEIKHELFDNTIQMDLKRFWTGNLRYGLSGSVVMYIDHKFGRKRLIELLKFKEKTELLAKLNINEQELLFGWKQYIEQYHYER